MYIYVYIFIQHTALHCNILLHPADLADRGLACFLLNENANILLDRKMMSLTQQHPDSLAFQPAMRDLHAEEPFLMHLLLQVNAISQGVSRQEVTTHSSVPYDS